MVRDYPVPVNEAARVASLQALSLVNSPRQPEFDAVVELACEMFGMPIALVSILDDQQQWFKASKGLDVCSTERESAFCNYPVATGDLMVVPDASADGRFSKNRLVTGGPLIRFYAGVPISIDAGIHLGTLCVIDTKPREFGSAEADRLTRMAEIVTALLRQFREARLNAAMAVEIEEQDCLSRSREQALVRHKYLFERASALTKTGAWDWNLRNGEVTWSDGMYDIHDLPRGGPVKCDEALAFYDDDTRAKLQTLFAASDRDLAGFSFEGEMKTAKGVARWIRLSVDVECSDGRVVRRFGLEQDVTDQKATWDRLQFLAECDPLTALANRTVLHRHLQDANGQKIQDQACSVLLLIDIDGFKHVNDTFGHAAGDRCLKQIAKRLERACGNAEVIARLGGDEFAILLSIADPHGVGEACARRVLDAVQRQIRWRGDSFKLTASVGMAVCEAAVDRSRLMTEADLALYAAKSAGRNTARMFAPEMREAEKARFETVRNIARAMARNQLELFYQPKVRLADDTLAGFEALLRWRRPDGQVVTAGAFAAAFEDPDLSGRIGKWVLATALRQAQAWQRAGLLFGHIAINLSSSQFCDDGYATELIGQIAAHGLTPDMIEVEVTEGVLMGNAKGGVRQTLKVLRDAGIRIALDDFGTGFASLAHLRNFPVDIIKVDRSFVQDFLTSSRDHAILQSILFLARHLGIEVVAEGIEETEQFEFLQAIGCRYGQGYFFSKAVPAFEAAEWCSPVLTSLSA